MINDEKLSKLKEYIDMEDALKRVMGSKKIYKKLITSYTANDYAGKLVEDHNKGDLEEAVKSAHAIKGVAGNLSFTKLHDLSAKIEASVKAGELCPDTIDEFKEAEKQTREYLDYLIETI